MKKYLPSKKFLYIFGSFVIVALVFFAIFYLFSSKNSFFASEKEGKLKVDRLALAGLTVDELVKKDSDYDGIPDWEEALWGTDKNKVATFDIADSVYIENKKKELNINPTKDEAGLTETEKFAREFFTAYVAMKTSGTVDPNMINNFSSALGQKIVTPDLIDYFSTKDVKAIDANTTEEKEKYYMELKTLFVSYKTKGIGSELDIINNQLTSPGSKKIDKLTPIAEAYKDFAKKVMNISVPNDLSGEHLKIANSANNTGISVSNMVKITNDPIVGLSGLSQYKKYSDDLIDAVTELETKLQL